KLTPDGKLLASGIVGSGARLFRFTADGHRDAAFSSDGIVDLPSDLTFVAEVSLAVDDTGRAIVLGQHGLGNDADFALVRYTADGLLDTTFGAGGTAVSQTPLEQDDAFTVAIAADG